MTFFKIIVGKINSVIIIRLKLKKGQIYMNFADKLIKLRKKMGLSQEELAIKKTKRGGARAGSGRKKTCVKSYAFHAPQEVYDILENVQVQNLII